MAAKLKYKVALRRFELLPFVSTVYPKPLLLGGLVEIIRCVYDGREVVPEAGLEPAHPCGREILNVPSKLVS